MIRHRRTSSDGRLLLAYCQLSAQLSYCLCFTREASSQVNERDQQKLHRGPACRHRSVLLNQALKEIGCCSDCREDVEEIINSVRYRCEDIVVVGARCDVEDVCEYRKILDVFKDTPNITELVYRDGRRSSLTPDVLPIVQRNPKISTD